MDGFIIGLLFIVSLFILYCIYNLLTFICIKYFNCDIENDDEYDNIYVGNYNNQTVNGSENGSESEYESNDEIYTEILINEKKQETLLENTLSKHTSIFKLDNSYEKCCSICLDNMEKNELVRSLPCFHTYHVKCIDDWFFRNKEKFPPICPDCTVPIIKI